MPKHPRPLLSLVAVSFFACNVFDESLIPSDPGDGGTQAEKLGEDCVGRDIPTFESLNEFRQIDTTHLKNDRYQLSCVGNARGNDGFFKVEMEKGKKWHFHVKVTPGTEADPAVYVLDSGCQDSVCQRGWGLNECVAGQDEHFSFFPPRSGTYFVGVDSMTPGGEPLQVLAVQPDCGNNIKEHSETCDDGNLDPGDGCDELCRSELSKGNAKEVEPNDEPKANANVLLLDGKPLTVTGQLGGTCDFDSFAFDVEEGGAVRARLEGTGGDGCSVDLKLQLVDTDGLTPLGTVRTQAGECPELDGTESFASGLDAGTYFVRITTEREDEPESFDYALEVEVLAP
jgi:cysteine-rich repeat protein